MEVIIEIWNFAPNWRLRLLMLAFAAMMMVTVWIYLKTSKARLKAGSEGRITAADYAITDPKTEPEDLAVYTRLIMNLFELPVLFYALVLAFSVLSIESWVTVILAWLFVLTRFLHAYIMINGNRVMKRRRMFVRSIIIYMLMLAEFVLALIFIAEL